MGTALATVEVQHEREKQPRIVRISGRVKRAIDHMVFEGLKRANAAEKAKITDHALYCAMRQPHVLAYLNAQQQVLRTSAAARSIARIDNLADGAESEHVKLQSNVFLLGIEGISPVTKSENTTIHKGLVPGLTLNLLASCAPIDDARVIDGQAHQVREPIVINRIGQSVPHPDAGNVVESEPLPEKTKSGRRKPGRGK